MELWIGISAVSVNVIVIVTAVITLFSKIGKWEQKMNDTCDSIEQIQSILTAHASTLQKHEGRISYLEGVNNGKILQ